jgi:hypothetical protein
MDRLVITSKLVMRMYKKQRSLQSMLIQVNSEQKSFSTGKSKQSMRCVDVRRKGENVTSSV